MDTIFIRTNFNENIGLGHFTRMNLMGIELEKKYQVIFLIDKSTDHLKFSCKFKVIAIYKNNEKFKNQFNDALIVKKIVSSFKTKAIIVDDYRCREIWEKIFFKKYKIISFDDNNKYKHCSHIIVDSKWTGPSTYSRYNNLVSKCCIKLLGPKYSIFSKVSVKKKRNKNNKFNIIFYIGGAGNFSKYYKFLGLLGNLTLNHKKLIVQIIIGPLSKNYKELIVAFANNYKNIEFIKGKKNLFEYFYNADLYIGVSSSVIYELSYCKVPAVVFSSTKNQQNNILDLEDLGIFFQIKESDFSKLPNKVFKFIKILIKNEKKIKEFVKPKINLDRNGAKRISLIVDNVINNNYIEKAKEYKITNNNKDQGSIFKVDNSLINLYLKFRNHKKNRKQSISTNIISNIDHYIWWFEVKKKLYYLENNRKKVLFFFHQIKKIKNKKFYYGGWFAGEGNVNIFDIYSIVKWQTTRFKKYPWFAIIKKTNKLVEKINIKVGFLKIAYDQTLKTFFQKKDAFKKFNFYIKK